MSLFIKRHAYLFCATASVAAIHVGTTPASAQGVDNSAQSQSSARSAGRIDEFEDDQAIVVTAQFREQRLQDTPLSITAIGAATLEAREQRSVADLGQFAPNVNVSQGSSLYGNALSAFIRGVGQNDSNFALEPGVGVYIDDVYYGTTFGAVFDLTDLERVEILRGPQGTLAGKNSVGGALKLFSKEPNATDGGFVEATYGRFGRLDGRASANFQVAEDLFARASLVSRSTNGYLTRLDFGCANPGQGIAANPTAQDNCKVGTEGGTDVQALRLALRYAPAAPYEINLVGDVARDDSEVVATKLLFANNPNIRSYDAANPFGGVPFDSRFLTAPRSRTSYATYCNGGNYTTFAPFNIPYQVAPSVCLEPKSTSESYGLAGTIEVDLADNLSLKSITAYRRASGTSAIDVDGSPIDILIQSVNLSHRQFTQELRLTGNIGTFADFTVGGFYYDGSDRLRLRVEIPDVIFDFLTNDPVSNVSKSLFAHTEFHLLPGLNVIGGIRYTDDKKTYTFSRRNTDGSLPSGAFFTPNFLLAGLEGMSGTFQQDQIDYRFGLNYRWSESLMTYAQLSTGFKGGGINPTPYVPDQVRLFGPEKVMAYEAGFKADMGQLFRLNGAVFYNDYSDIQTTLYSCPPSASPACALRANAGDARVKGAELEALIRPVKGLTLEGSMGYLDFQYTSVNPVTGITPDMKAPFNAEWQASAGIQYVADLGGSGMLTPRLDWDYRSSFYNNAINNPFSLVPGRSIFNARLTYETRDGDWRMSGGVTNLFGKFYYNAINENVGAYGVATGVLGRPREWSVTVRRSF